MTIFCLIPATLGFSCHENKLSDGFSNCSCSGYEILEESYIIDIKCHIFSAIINIYDSNITYFNYKLLDELENLGSVIELNFNDVGIQYIQVEGNNFYWGNIRKISFSNNKLLKLSDIPLVNLEIAHFENNKIVDISAFSSAYKLREVYLSHNRLYQIPTSTFASLLYLKVLKLDHNRLTQISKDTFKNNYELEMIDLSYNKITRVDVNFYKSFPEKFTLRIGGLSECINRYVEIIVENGDTSDLEDILMHCFAPTACS